MCQRTKRAVALRFRSFHLRRTRWTSQTDYHSGKLHTRQMGKHLLLHRHGLHGQGYPVGLLGDFARTEVLASSRFHSFGVQRRPLHKLYFRTRCSDRCHLHLQQPLLYTWIYDHAHVQASGCARLPHLSDHRHLVHALSGRSAYLQRLPRSLGFPPREPNRGPVLKEGDKFVFLSEPQFWINLNRIKGIDKDFNLSIGTEMEISRNFARMDKFSCIPTLAVKWTFN